MTLIFGETDEENVREERIDATDRLDVEVPIV